MPLPLRSHLPFRPTLPFILLAILLGILWIAGGASRADALGQSAVRAAALAVLVTIILFGERRPLASTQPVGWFLLAAFLLVVAQMVPLPPSLWQMLPGRAVFTEADTVAGYQGLWRPWAIVPGATVNAATSLIVPFAILVLVGRLDENGQRWLPGLLLLLIIASTLVGLLQFAGMVFDNPLINDSAGQVSGSFANRNHFAVFLAFGCLLAPVWAFLHGRKPRWRAPAAFGLVLLFELTILASGSRAGLLAGVLALGIGLVMVRRDIGKALRRYPRWVAPTIIIGAAIVVAITALFSFAAGRAVSIDRVFTVDAGQDMRVRALPTVIEMLWKYFPAGGGFGGFDPLFRLNEPFDLLQINYFNHAHNDFLEVVLDGGIIGLTLLVAAVAWWAWASLDAWRAAPRSSRVLSKLGSIILLLVFIASIFDYPARTPMIMALVVISAMWLSGGMDERDGPALPGTDQHL